MIQIVCVSFGYRHGPPPTADVTVDVREHLRDPHVDPAMRGLTGRDMRVAHRVLTTPGAADLAGRLADVMHGLAELADRRHRYVTLAVGCAGGRHRSVALAEYVAGVLQAAGWGVEVEHRDIGLPVLPAAARQALR